jgi:hypothetical protein
LSDGNEQAAARKLEDFLRENDFQSVARNRKGYDVEVDSGTITIKLSNDPARCTADGGVINTDIAVDVQALRVEDDDPAEFERMTILRLPFRRDAARTLRSAYDAHEELIAEARAQHGWGLTAAVAASEAFTARHGEALALYREDFTHCNGARSVQITDPTEWAMELWPSADPFEFMELLRRYQASLGPEQAHR